MRHVVVSTAIFLASLVIGVAVKDLGIVLELTGGFSATFLGFILPASCYLRLEPGKMSELATWQSPNKVGALVLLIFGIVAMISSTTLTLIKASQG